MDYIYDILPIIKQAGNKISNNFRFNRSINMKGLSNYVTDLDKRIEEFIISSILEIYPDIPFISEESINSVDVPKFWVLDPIDGTTNLIHGYKSTCISLAHVRDNEPIFGAVYCVQTKEMFVAIKGQGAWIYKNSLSKYKTLHIDEIHPINVNSISQLSNSIVGFGCPYDKSKIPYLFSILEPIITTCDDLKRVGPASLDICYVACGRLSAYIELDLEFWDYAAGALILKEAGGKITNFYGDGNPVGKSHIVASNNLIHDEILNKINNL